MTNGAPSGSVTVQRRDLAEEPGNINVGNGERLLSVIAGTVMTLYGVRKMSPSGLALMLSGGALIYRGLSGRSILYEQFDIDTSTIR